MRTETGQGRKKVGVEGRHSQSDNNERPETGEKQGDYQLVCPDIKQMSAFGRTFSTSRDVQLYRSCDSQMPHRKANVGY